MKILIAIFLAIPSFALASGLTLSSVKQVTWLPNDDEDPGMLIRTVPFVTAYASPEWYFSAISAPFIPSSDSSWKKPHDINLVSVYGIVVSGTYKKESKDIKVTIDVSNAKVPEGYPYTIEQVADKAKECVNLMYPHDADSKSKLEIVVVESKK